MSDDQLPARGIFYDRREPDLMLSTGNPPSGSRPYPTRLEFFRAKPGADNQWGAAARAFNKHYECELGGPPDFIAKSGPKSLVIRFPSDRVEDVLDVRYLAFTQSRLAAKGDSNYVTVPAWRHSEPEWITAFPSEGDPSRFTIRGPDDPLCLGGAYGIPVDTSHGKPTGKPTLTLVASLSFTLVDVGALSSITQYQTGSVAIRSRLWRDLTWIASSLGPLSGWLFELRGKPGRRSYRDEDGKHHTTKTWDPYLLGPLDPETREPVTVAAAMESAKRLRLAGATHAPVAELPSATPTPAGGWELPPGADDEAEEVAGEVVDETTAPPARNPDDDIPF